MDDRGISKGPNKNQIQFKGTKSSARKSQMKNTIVDALSNSSLSDKNGIMMEEDKTDYNFDFDGKEPFTFRDKNKLSTQRDKEQSQSQMALELSFQQNNNDQRANQEKESKVVHPITELVSPK